MSKRLRVLVEINGDIVADFEREVDDAKVDIHHPVKPVEGLASTVKQYESTGWHSIAIEWETRR